ncbi:MAG: bifunctional folylpolyglutamate synthase/dihydrofolate synthase [Oscillospiraceae bacterium]|jgi:dihydrofolate synthase/folylpolyglutamate synthase|nr:bifunctional folylpolyglutamate synthase/dihydrofolate synthase [Oscillospiraceae bacterium]
MNYRQALDYINRTAQMGSKPGLERIAALLDAFGNPHKRLKFVHVAGTNGKGSVCAMVESVLRAAGYKTGFFISPYLEDYCERIQVSREWIPREKLAGLITEADGHIQRITAGGGEHARKFEIETAVALTYFAEQRCDVVVLEVGLGGRLDATNIIPSPEVAVITSLSYDHTHILGGTLEQIAAEKRGIIKPGCAVVDASALPPAEKAELSLSGSRFTYKQEEYIVSLIGAHQVQNAAVAIEAVNALRERGWPVSGAALKEGLRAAQWGGRLEIIRREPLCLIDGAHNQDAVEQLCKALDTLLAGRRIITVMAMSADKRHDLCVPMLAGRSSCFITTEFKDMHPAKADVLARYVPDPQSRDPARYPLSVEVIADTDRAVRRALELAGPDDVVLACGSLYMIGDAKRSMLH